MDFLGLQNQYYITMNIDTGTFVLVYFNFSLVFKNAVSFFHLDKSKDKCLFSVAYPG